MFVSSKSSYLVGRTRLQLALTGSGSFLFFVVLFFVLFFVFFLGGGGGGGGELWRG